MKNITKKLLLQSDIMNTLNGGMSLPKINMERKEGQYELNVTTPGIDTHSLGVEINEHVLHIYHQFKARDGEREVIVPRMLQEVPIPRDVDRERIHADHSNGRLKVHLPLGEYSNGFHRRVNING